MKKKSIKILTTILLAAIFLSTFNKISIFTTNISCLRPAASPSAFRKASSSGKQNEAKKPALLVLAAALTAGCVSNQPEKVVSEPLSIEATRGYVKYIEYPSSAPLIDRYEACVQLANAGPWKDRVLPKLRRVLIKDPSWRVRAKAVIAIYEMGALTEKDIRSLVDLIDNRGLPIETRRGIADELLTIKISEMPEDSDSILREMLEDTDTDSTLRIMIADILGYEKVGEASMLDIIISLSGRGSKAFLMLDRLEWLRKHDKRRPVRKAAKLAKREILKSIERRRQEEERKRKQQTESLTDSAA